MNGGMSSGSTLTAAREGARAGVACGVMRPVGSRTTADDPERSMPPEISTTNRMIAPAMAMMPIASVTSDLDLHDACDPERAQEQQHRSRNEKADADTGVHQWIEVSPLKDQQVSGHDERQRNQDAGRYPALCAEHLDLTAKLGSLTHRLNGVLQDFGKIATDFAGDANSHDNPVQVHAGHPAGNVVERILELGSEPDLRQRAGKL